TALSRPPRLCALAISDGIQFVRLTGSRVGDVAVTPLHAHAVREEDGTDVEEAVRGHLCDAARVGYVRQSSSRRVKDARIKVVLHCEQYGAQHVAVSTRTLYDFPDHLGTATTYRVDMYLRHFESSPPCQTTAAAPATPRRPARRGGSSPPAC